MQGQLLQTFKGPGVSFLWREEALLPSCMSAPLPSASMSTANSVRNLNLTLIFSVCGWVTIRLNQPRKCEIQSQEARLNIHSKGTGKTCKLWSGERMRWWPNCHVWRHCHMMASVISNIKIKHHISLYRIPCRGQQYYQSRPNWNNFEEKRIGICPSFTVVYWQRTIKRPKCNWDMSIERATLNNWHLWTTETFQLV